MNHSEVAHAWAHDNYNRNGEVNGSRMFATERNRTIYSHGYHFPMARKTSNPEFPLLLTYRGYSNSTSKHLGYVWNAISHFSRRFECYCPSDDEREIYRREMEDHVPDLISDLDRIQRRIDYWKERVDKRAAKGQEPSDMLDTNLQNAEEDHAAKIREIQNRIDELERFRIAFDVKVNSTSKKVQALRQRYLKGKWATVPADMEKLAERARKRQEEAYRKQQEERKVKEAENLVLWLQGEQVQLYYQENPAQMRVRNGSVETTLGARVPVEDAAKAVRFIEMVRERGKDWRANGERHSVGGFDIDAITEHGVVVGCHRFTHDEIERVKPQILSHHYSQQEQEVAR